MTAALMNDRDHRKILVIDGKGSINGKTAKKGDSFFVPASFGEYTLNGNIEVLITMV